MKQKWLKVRRRVWKGPGRINFYEQLKYKKRRRSVVDVRNRDKVMMRRGWELQEWRVCSRFKTEKEEQRIK